MSTFFGGFVRVIGEVLLALAPIVLLFLLLQVTVLKLPRRRVRTIVTGMLLAFLGLVLFLQGVSIAFIPVGNLIGRSFGALNHKWLLIPIGFVLGAAVILAEPAVIVLVDQIDRVSAGSINKKVMLGTLCIGVGAAVALSMLRVIAGISLWYFLLPGYTLALVLAKYSNPIFTAIAFDSGGVATGPMTVTYILSIAVGVATQMEGRNPLLDGFGIVSLVALTPILSILLLGLVYSRISRINAHVREDEDLGLNG